MTATKIEPKIEPKIEVKVWVELMNAEKFVGKIFINASERLQDVMNDDRQFIPIHKLLNTKNPVTQGDKWVLTIINKTGILRIDEA